MDEKANELETAPIGRLLLKFSLPAMTGTVVTSMYNIVDRIFLGRYVGEQGIAATTTAFPLMLIMMAFGMLIAFGTNSLISIRLGQKEPQEAEKLLGQGLFLFFWFSVIFTVVGLVFLRPLLRLFGTSDDIMPFAVDYLGIVLLGTLSHSISFGVNNFIRGEGNPKTAMKTMLIGGILNIFLDYLFIARMGWGMKGAAWATVLGYSVSAAWVLFYYLSGTSVVKFYRKNFCSRLSSVRTVLVMGSPHFIMNLVASAQMALFNNQLVRYGGDLEIAVMGVIMSFNLIWLMPVIGISQGMQPIVGFNHGADRPERVRRTLLLGIAAVTAIGSLITLLIFLFPEKVFALFVATPDSRMIATGTPVIRIFLALLPFIGFMILTGNYFQFTGRPKISLLLTLSRQVIFLIPCLIILPRFFGLPGVWYAVPISDAGALCGTLFAFVRELKQLANRITRKNPIHDIDRGEKNGPIS
jgi:putative MATE family efflux protein